MRGTFLQKPAPGVGLVVAEPAHRAVQLSPPHELLVITRCHAEGEGRCPPAPACKMCGHACERCQNIWTLALGGTSGCLHMGEYILDTGRSSRELECKDPWHPCNRARLDITAGQCNARMRSPQVLGKCNAQHMLTQELVLQGDLCTLTYAL
eukprot:1160635-Pelagomonas_calceolata.AAC.3